MYCAINATHARNRSLWGAAAYWIYRGHYRYAYDEALWILGFFAIERNISDWKSDIRSGEA